MIRNYQLLVLKNLLLHIGPSFIFHLSGHYNHSEYSPALVSLVIIVSNYPIVLPIDGSEPTINQFDIDYTSLTIMRHMLTTCNAAEPVTPLRPTYSP